MDATSSCPELCPDAGAAGADGGHCQLRPGHKTPHALATSEAYYTWTAAESHRWRRHPGPPWLFALPWASGRQPAIHRPARADAADSRFYVDERNTR